MTTPGYRIKLHSALVAPIMLAGAPRLFTILNGTICAALVLALHAFYILPVCFLVQIIAVFLAKKDPYFFDVMLRHLRKKKFYNV
jgi:type IV secretion system protein TrbD